MPDQLTPMETALVNRESEAPDPAIVKAIDLINAPEHRPTVPVRLYDNPEKLFKEVLSRFGGPKLSPNAIAAVPVDKSAIWINKKSKEFREPYQLASKLIHEQYHVAAPPHDRREGPAYERELAFVNQYPARFDSRYRTHLAQLLAQFQNKEKDWGKAK